MRKENVKKKAKTLLVLMVFALLIFVTLQTV